MKKPREKAPTETEANVNRSQPETIAAYNKLMAHAEVVGVGLVRSSAVLHSERIDELEDLAVHTPPAKIRGSFSPETHALTCGVLLSVTLGPKDLAPDRHWVDVEAEYSVSYKISDGVEVSNDIIYLFAGRNAVFTAWPFFRELAHSLVARMEMPPLVLPLFRMPQLPKPGTH